MQVGHQRFTYVIKLLRRMDQKLKTLTPCRMFFKYKDYKGTRPGRPTPPLKKNPLNKV